MVGGRKVHVEGAFSTNDIFLLRGAVLRGLGIALLPTFLVEPELADGSLVQVLAGLVGSQSRVSVVYPERELMPAHVRAFVDAVVAWAPSELGKLTLSARREPAEASGAPNTARASARPVRARASASKTKRRTSARTSE